MAGQSSPGITVAATDASGRELRTTKSERTKGLMLAAARRVFEDRGFREARVTDIADEAGVAHGTFYRYFKSKDDIFRALAEGVRDSLLSAQQRSPIYDDNGAPPPDLETVRRGIEINMRSYLADYQVEGRLLVVMREVAASDPIVRDVLADVDQRLTGNTTRALNSIADLGGTTVHPETFVTARLIRRLVDAVAVDWFVDGVEYDEESTVQALVSSWLRLAGLEA